MGEEHEHYGHLPQVIVLHPPPILLTMFEKQFSEKFHFIRPWESPMPTDLFLRTCAHSAKAMLSTPATPITAEALQYLPSLQLIITENTGVDHIDVLECRKRGISIANAGTVFSEDVADMAVGLLISILRRITAAARFLHDRIWHIRGDLVPDSKLGGKRVGIVGLGSIGSEVAKRLQSFGCIISYHSRRKKPNVPYPFYSNISELASNSDALIICCALTDQTRHMVNREVMLALGKEGVIVNIARGAIIDEEELVRCLLHGEIAGAGLDVFEREPNLPEEFLTMDNVVLSPHRAAFTEEGFLNAFQLVMGNLEAFFSNKPLLSPVIIG